MSGVSLADKLRVGGRQDSLALDQFARCCTLVAELLDDTGHWGQPAKARRIRANATPSRTRRKVGRAR